MSNTTDTKLPLERRCAIALSDPIKADAIGRLVSEVESAITEADETAEAERVKALDPIASPNADAARKTMEDTAFKRDRLLAVLPRLRERYQEVAAAEYLTAWRSDHDALKPVGDALAAELRGLYPKFAGQLVDLLVRIKAHNADLSSLHQRRPSGVPLHLDDPELVARGIEAFSPDARPLADGLQLPAFEPGQRPMHPAPFNPAVFVPQVVDNARRYSGDWHTAMAEEQRVLRERQEREAVEQEAKARENWHGPRWWEGERA